MKIVLNSVNKKYGNTTVLDNINYSFYPGNVYLIKGVSGAGKTTLLEIITKKIRCDGKLSYDSIDTMDFAYSIKSDLIEYLTIRENLHLLAQDDKIIGITNELKISKTLDEYPANVSAGQYQRASLARLFLSNKKVLILDEPTSALDYDNKKIIYDYLYEHRQDKIIIVVSHDYSDTRFINLHIENNMLVEESENIVNDGKIICQDTINNFNMYSVNKIIKGVIKKRWLLMLLVSIFNIILILMSFVLVSFKDSRDKVVASFQTPLVEIDSFDPNAYYVANYNIGTVEHPGYIRCLFSPNNKFIFGDKEITLNDNEIITSSNLNIPDINVIVSDFGYNLISYNLVKEESFNNHLMIGKDTIDISNFNNIYYNYFSLNNKEITGNNVRAICYNIDEANLENEILTSSSPLLKKYDNYIVTSVEHINDNTGKSYINFEFSKDVYDYISDNIVNICMDYNKTSYISSKFINKNNVFNYDLIKEQYKSEYNTFKAYSLSRIVLLFICLFITLGTAILFSIIHKKYQHSKEILLALNFSNYKLRLLYYGTFILLLMGYLVAIILSIVLKTNLEKFVMDNYSIKNYSMDSFNYSVIINMLILVFITVFYSLKHKSIFYIDRM